MRIVTSRYGNIAKDYKIYETVEEIEKAKITPKTVPDIKVGDYMRSDNGFYVPVISLSKHRNKYTRRTEIWKIGFPGRAISVRYRLDTKKAYIRFKYSFDPAFNAKKNLSPYDKSIANAIAEGIPMMKAIKMIRPELNHQYTKQYANGLANKEKFIEYLILKLDMKSLKESLEDKELDYSFLIDALKQNIKDKNSLDTIKFGFELVRAVELEGIKNDNNNKQLDDKDRFTKELLKSK